MESENPLADVGSAFLSSDESVTNGEIPFSQSSASSSAEVLFPASKIEHLRSLLLLNLVLGHLKIFEAENMNVSIKLCSIAGIPFDSLHSAY